jgi:hypothetical protein
MRLSFCFLSNNIQNFQNMDQSFHFSLNDNSCISSFTKNVLFNPPIARYCYIPNWNYKWKIYHSYPTIDMFWMRQDSLYMAENADIIYIGDDDMEFKEGSTEVINQCCAYMQDNQDCGAIYLGGNFGGEGDFHKDEIYIANKGELGTNRGILVRNKPVILDNRFHALGAIFDCIVGFTCMMQGMYVARRLHVPIEHFTTNILKENHEQLFYDLNYINKLGIRNKVNEVIGEWTDRKGWPPSIFTQYRQAAMKSGYYPKYDIYGNITNEAERKNVKI